MDWQSRNKRAFYSEKDRKKPLEGVQLSKRIRPRGKQIASIRITLLAISGCVFLILMFNWFNSFFTSTDWTITNASKIENELNRQSKAPEEIWSARVTPYLSSPHFSQYLV
jgi:hypothetical protein